MPSASHTPASPRRATTIASGWLGAAAVCTAYLLAGLFIDVPTWSTRLAAVLLATLYAAALSLRLGGRALLPAALALAYGAVAILTEWETLLAGAAVGTAALAAALAIMGTVPAATTVRAILETLVACAVATAGGLACRGFEAGIHPDRFDPVVLGVTLLGSFVIVYRLGAGFHGLGRRGYAVAATATVLLALALAYTAAFGRWGNPAVVDALDDMRVFVRDHLNGVPHPIEVILGIPALCWGIFMRARRRQGWWVCAFGAAFTAPSAGRFLVLGVPPSTALISFAYTIVLGFALAWVVIRVDRTFTGGGGRRALRDEAADAHRPEPGRFEALR